VAESRQLAGGERSPTGPRSLLLALETATRTQSVALARGDDVCAERVAEGERPGAESLLPLVQAVLAQAGVGLDAVAALAVSIGPGSFTGLRIGLATAKGLAFGTGRPVVPVPTLLALAASAASAGVAGVLAPVLDARRGELYAAAYAPHGDGWRECVRPGLYAPAALAAILPRPCTLVGEGVAVAAGALRAAAGVALGPELAPRAAEVARLGARLLAAGGGVAAEALAPRYLRRAEAEAKRTGDPLERPGPDSTLR
jgi:tRNA threonylcarbamoyladenosine biosynthesis protein TsaB